MLFFQIYPTLLNEYHRYLKSPDEHSKNKLINRINRVPEKDPALLEKFRKGNSFEAAVLKNQDSFIDIKLIEKARSLLPENYKTQQFIQFVHKNIRFYGYADVVGMHKVIDLKSTSYYQAERHQFNFQNLYLYALKSYGFSKMEYIICDFKKIYIESYALSTYDFPSLLEEMEQFTRFLVLHRNLIKDKKIIIDKDLGLFS